MASDLDLELRDLQQYFASRLPERLEEIEITWKEVRDRGWALDALRELHRLTHSLTGAGGTFGFPEVTRTARALERCLKEQLEPSEPSRDEAVVLRVEALLEDLRTAAETPPPEPLPSLLAQGPAAPHAEERLVFLIEDDADLGTSLEKQLQPATACASSPTRPASRPSSSGTSPTS